MSQSDQTCEQLRKEARSLRARVAELERAEAASKSGQVELEKQVEQRTAELRRANESLRAEISQRQRTQAELLEWKNRYEAAVQASGHVLYDWNPAANTVTYGGNVEKILGYTGAELRGGMPLWISLIHPDDRAAFQRALERSCHTLEPFHFEYRVRKKDGSYLFVKDDGYFFLHQAGGAACLVGFVVDITQQRALEEQLRQAQKMEAIGRLAGGVAHDFNNLLTVINGYSTLLSGRLARTDPLHEPIEEIRKAGERAAGLVRQLLAFSRKQILQPIILDLNAVMADMERMLARLIGTNIELVTRPDPALGPVKADIGQIEQVILNLAVNARDAMPQGGRLTLETRNVELRVGDPAASSEVPPGPYALLAVTDTGCGMDADVRAHLFEPFFTTKELGQGTGLGLASVYGIVKQSGGHIEVDSVPGGGTTFRIYLPRSRVAVPIHRSLPGISVARQGKETVLLVEDDEGVRALARLILQTNGYRVLEARSGPEALELNNAHAGAIDLLVTDLAMPQMSGSELAEQLLPIRRRLKVLYMSGYAQEVQDRKHGQADHIGFLQKPFTPAALARKVREMLDE